MPKVLPAYAGEVKAVDIAVVYDDDLLLIRRGDGGGWALPGGMMHDGETDEVAMSRELWEETGVRAVTFKYVTGRFVVDDPRNRSDAWITTKVGLVQFGFRPDAVGADDAVDARWVPLSVGWQALDTLLRTQTDVGMYACHRPQFDAVVRAAR